MQLFTIESQSKYMIVVSQIANIEDATDDFVTAEEMCEMMGEDYNEKRTYYYSGRTLRREAIKEALSALKNEIVEKGKRTTLIKDEDLMDVFKEGYTVSEFVEGLRRVGNRLFLHEKKPNAPKKSNVTTLAWRVQRTVNKGNKFEIEIKYANHDVPATIALCKKLVSWDDIVWNDDGYNSVSEETIGFCKQIWDNPNIFDKVEKEESPT